MLMKGWVCAQTMNDFRTDMGRLVDRGVTPLSAGMGAKGCTASAESAV